MHINDSPKLQKSHTLLQEDQPHHKIMELQF